MQDEAADKRDQARAALLADGRNAIVWRDLIAEMASTDKPPIPIIGTEFREMCGYPVWGSFLRSLARRVGVASPGDDDATFANITTVAGPLFLSDEIEAAYGLHEPPRPLPGALAMLPFLVREAVVTSSFSREFEVAFSAATDAPLGIHKLSDYGSIEIAAAVRARLFKLRGDVMDRKSRALTSAEFQAHLHESAEFKAFIEDWRTSGRSMLFIGMSLRGSPLADALPTKSEDFPPSYALLDASWRDDALSSWLYERRIRPIWFSRNTGQFENCLMDLAEALVSPAVRRPARWPVPEFYAEPRSEAIPEIPAVPAEVEPPRPRAQAPEPAGILVDAVNRNECIAFVGSGLSARAGMPTWRGFVAGLVQRAEELGCMSMEEAQQQRAALADGEINAVADNAIDAFADRRDELFDYYRRASTPAGATPRAIELLRSIPFAGILTSNYDKLLLEALPGVTTTLTPRDGDALLQAHAQSSQRYLVQLYGDLDRPDTVITAPADYLDLVSSNAAFSRFIEGIFFSRTILFVGTSIEGLTDFLGGFRFPSGVPREHFALVAVQGRRWQAQATTLKRRYNINVLAYSDADDFVQFDQFLATLARRVKVATPRQSDSSAGRPQLTRIELRNIGPYAQLDLDLTQLRTILLGDNGVGKSTILKAVALAIVGSEGRHYASRILKSGESSGSIRILTRRNPSGYQIEIQKVGDESEVIARSSRMLEAEGWVALGFPPLRTTSWSPTKGPQGVATRRPAASDLLPLLSGDVDTRMDDLKQWLVNTDATTRDERVSVAERERAKAVMTVFIKAVGVLAEGLPVSFAEVTSDFRVLVRTPDGVVPIEALSQGMTSLLSWIGIVIQRLHEVGSGGEHVDPMTSPGLILMDEIDAHMHPAWQQKLLSRLKTLLPNVQVIASTHSPLVVAGLEPSEVVRFARDASGKVLRVDIDRDMTFGRADQILTGDLFGLESTLALGEQGEEIRVEYEALLAKSRRTPEEDARLAELGGELRERIPSALAENKLERRSQELVQAVLTTDFRAEDAGPALAEKATQVLQSMGWKDMAPGDPEGR